MSSPRTIVYTARHPESPSGSVPEYTAPLANSDMFYNFSVEIVTETSLTSLPFESA